MYKYLSPSLYGRDKSVILDSVREQVRVYTRGRYPSYTTVMKGTGDIAGVTIPDSVIDALGGFGGGVAGTGNLCGALTGGLALLGFMLGEEVSATRAFQNDMPSLVHDQSLSGNDKMSQFLELMKRGIVFTTLANRFEERLGSINCRDLSKPWQDNLISRERFKNCHRIMEETAVMVMELLFEVEEKGITLGA